MQSIVVKAHGKINLSLDILDRYSNGYHQIRSVMQSIALADKLTVSKTAAGIDLQVNISSIPAQENLAYKAAQRFSKQHRLHRVPGLSWRRTCQ